MLTLNVLCDNLKKLGESEAGVVLIDALAKHASSYAEYSEVAGCYQALKQYNKCLQYAEKALACTQLQDEVITAKYNIVNAYSNSNYPEKALKIIKQLETFFPLDIDLHVSKAFALFLNNQKNEAEVVLRNALNIKGITDKQKTTILFNLGTYELLRDEFQSGLSKFLFQGRKMDIWKKPQLRFNRWEGEIIKGKKIILLAEAGLGDEFVNFRFMKTIKDLGMNPIWFSPNKQTTNIFKRLGYNVLNSMEYIKHDDKEVMWTHSMDVPVYLNMKPEDLWYGPYLSANKSLSSPVKKTDKLKIGIRWQGNPEYDQDLHRTIPLKEIYNVVKDIDADFYSLQRDDGFDQLEDFPGIIDISKNLKDFEATLKVIDDLDFVITSCTSVAHAAAAMGKKTLLFTPISHYYTWCHTSKYSPWYGEHVEIFRQQRPRTWAEPIEELRKYLEIYKK